MVDQARGRSWTRMSSRGLSGRKSQGCKLGESLTRTLELLRLYARDLKLTKSSILTSAGSPQFPHSEWQNVITGAMVDLDHVISGSFAGLQ
jgi:hypothetical protein